MAYPNYPKTRNEQLWVVPEPSFNVLAQPDSPYQVVPIDGVSIAQASPEYTPSIERRGTAGRKDIIKRKIVPAEFSLPFYAKTAATAGDTPSYDHLLRCGMGVRALPAGMVIASLETSLAGTNDDLHFDARAPGTAGNTVQIEYLVAGNNTPLSVVVTGQKVTVNVATSGVAAAISTAAQVRAAIQASPAAMNLLSGVSFKTGNDGSGVVAALVATNLTGGLGTGAAVTYSFATDIDELSCSLWHYTDNLMRGARGIVVNTITLEGSGSDEPKITFAGFVSYMVFAGVGVTAGAHTAGVTTIQLAPGKARNFSLGLSPTPTDFLFLQWDTEVCKLTAVDYTLDQLTVVRGQQGSTAASHLDLSEIGPWKPALTTDPGDIISPVILGDCTLDGVSTIVVSFNVTINNNMEPRLDEYAQVAATGWRRSDLRDCSTTLRLYVHKDGEKLLSNLDREKAENVILTLGSLNTGRLRIPMPVVRFLEPPTFDGGGPEFQIEFAGSALETVANDELTYVYD